MLTFVNLVYNWSEPSPCMASSFVAETKKRCHDFSLQERKRCVSRTTPLQQKKHELGRL